MGALEDARPASARRASARLEKGDSMGWFDNLWRRRQGRTTDDTLEPSEPDVQVADELEEEAHDARDEQAIEEPRPPGG